MYKFLNGSDIVTMINTIGAKEYLGDRSSLLSLESATYLLFSEKIEIQRLWGKWESFIFYLSDAGYSGRFLYVKYRKRGVNEFKILNEDGSLVRVLPLEPVERCAENTKRGISSSFCEVLNCFCLRMPICKAIHTLVGI